MQREEVVGLQHLVGELGERDAGAEPRPHGLARHHGADPEVLADVPQERNHLELREPLVVVDEQSRLRPPVEVEEGPHLGLEPVGRRRHLLLRAQRALSGLAGRVADEAGPPADQHDRPVAGQLKAPQAEQRHQVAHVEAVGGGIEAHVDQAGRLGEVGGELRGRGDVRHEVALLEIPEYRRRHGLALPRIIARSAIDPCGRPPPV